MAAIAAGDTVTFDANSPAAAAVTTSAAISCTTLTFAAGFTGSLTMSNALTVSGVVTLTQGTLNTNGQTCAWGSFSSSNSNVRTLTLGASAVSISGTGTPWDCTTSTSLTVTNNTATITFSGAAGGVQMGAASTCNYSGTNLVFTGAGQPTMGSPNGTVFCNNLTRTGTAITTDGLLFNSATTYIIGGTLNLTGNSVSNRLFVGSNVIGTAHTVQPTAVSLTNLDFQDITAVGTAWSGTSLGDALGNTNITFTAPVTRYWIGGTGNQTDTTHWSASSGGASGASMPICHDAIIIDANSFAGTGTITFPMGRICKNFDASAATNSPGISFSVATTIFGDLSLSSGWGTWNSAITLSGRSSQTITSSGKTFASTFTITAPSGTYTLQDNLAVTNTLTVNNGTFDANNKNLSCSTFVSNSGFTRTINMGSGTWTLSGTGTVWSASVITSLTLNQGTSTIVLSDTGASAKNFDSGGASGYTLHNVTFTGGGTGAVNLRTFTQLDGLLAIGAPKTVTFTAARTWTVGDLVANGSVGNIITINTTVGGSAATLSKASGRVTLDYVSLQDITATGGSAFYAGSHSTNVSGNTGWIFTSARQLGSNTTRTQAGTRTQVN